MPRTIDAHYEDPVDLIWLGCARALGMTVARSDEVFASWDGRDTLTLSTPEGFDPDDSLAQLILHEICHALVEGPRGRRLPDWGLENIDDRHLVREHACHRLQAALTDRYGLREVLAPTTDHRPYYDALPPDPLAPGEDPAIDLARAAWPEATRGDWAPAIDRALAATAAVAAATNAALGPDAPPDSLWSRARPLHPAGFPAGPAEHTCGGCAWRDEGRCLQAAVGEAPGPAVAAELASCERWEPPLTAEDCADCGACCHRAFHQVPVEPDEPLAAAHPELVARDEYGLHLPRPGGLCVALAAQTPPWRCAHYELRPRSCRDFSRGGAGCLEARRRVGLSRAAPPVKLWG